MRFSGVGTTVASLDYMKPIHNLTGQRFGRLVVVSEAEHVSGRNRRWRVRCDCGTERVVEQPHLRQGTTQSCGCLRAERVSAAKTRHGAAGDTTAHYTATYQTWQAMKSRCHNPNASNYRLYGGRGITVCEVWRDDFAAFRDYMGERPTGSTIDRIDVNGHYEPGNVRWASAKVQANNRRTAA